MKPFYTEQDLVFKHSDIGELLHDIQSYGILNPDQRSTLVRLLEEARSTGELKEFPDMNALVGADSETGEFLLVIHDVYDPRNLLTVLFDRLTSIEEEDPQKDKEHALHLIDVYLGVIEKRERVSLQEVKQKLIQITTSMKDTMALFLEDEFSDKDLEKLSEALDKAYFEPLSELLEGVLVTIAGN
ncbi:MAG: hypothetical protein N2442_05735 [Spirochaetes bacterium]|nr:hypothetical protein [Spirochaetota bacterium]